MRDNAATTRTTSLERFMLGEVFSLLARPGVWVGRAPTHHGEHCLLTALREVAKLAGNSEQYHRCYLALLAAIDRLFPQRDHYGIPPFNDTHSLKDIQAVVLEAINTVDSIDGSNIPEPGHHYTTISQLLSAAKDGIVVAVDDNDHSIWEMPGWIVSKPRSYYSMSKPMLAQPIQELALV